MYNSIKVVKGNGGYGGFLVIILIEEKYKFIYIIGGGEKFVIVDKIVELIGMEVVNGFKILILDDEIVLVIIDCGGIFCCGIYFKKGIFIINVVLIGKSGFLV